jgi:hypothetical protein
MVQDRASTTVDVGGSRWCALLLLVTQWLILKHCLHCLTAAFVAETSTANSPATSTGPLRPQAVSGCVCTATGAGAVAVALP